MSLLGIKRKQFLNILKIAFKDWLKDKAVLKAGALTFFIILPLPTLLLIVIAILSLFFGELQAAKLVSEQIIVFTGPAIAGFFGDLISATGLPALTWSVILGIAFALGGAVGAFSVLRDMMNDIWEVKGRGHLSISKGIKKTIIPFVVVSALGLFVAAWAAILSNVITNLIILSVKGVFIVAVLNTAEILLSFALVALLLAVIYKIVPQVTITWRDVALTSIIISIIFTLVNYLFGFFLQFFTITTIAGTAASLLIILLWIYILNQIILFGAEFSKVYALTADKREKIKLPKSIEEAIEPFQEVGEKIEDAGKEDVEDTGKPRVKSK